MVSKVAAGSNNTGGGGGGGRAREGSEGVT